MLVPALLQPLTGIAWNPKIISNFFFKGKKKYFWAILNTLFYERKQAQKQASKQKTKTKISCTFKNKNVYYYSLSFSIKLSISLEIFSKSEKSLNKVS